MHSELVSKGHFEGFTGRCERADIVCPLCGIKFTLQTLEKHLGLHLQEIALLALPPFETCGIRSKSEEVEYSSDDLSNSEFIPVSTQPMGDQPPVEIRCICKYQHDDGFLISCNNCNEWQHGVCMGIDKKNIPELYLCSACIPGAHRLEAETAINAQENVLKTYNFNIQQQTGHTIDQLGGPKPQILR